MAGQRIFGETDYSFGRGMKTYKQIQNKGDSHDARMQKGAGETKLAGHLSVRILFILSIA